MKIKTKKQLNLPQLIEYIWDNDIKNECFRRLNIGPFEYVWVNEDSNIEFDDYMLFRKNDIFEIEIEEEITEDTVIPILIERRDFGNELTYSRYEYIRIKDIKEESSTLFYIENDDKSLTLIWRDGKLVE